MTRTAGTRRSATENACGFGRATRFLGYGQLVRLEPILIEIERLVCFGFGFQSPPRGWKKFGAWQSPEFPTNETRDSSFSGLNDRHVGADEKLALIF